MVNLTSSLTIKLIDDVSRPARTVAQALEQAEKQARAIAKEMASTGATDRLTGSLSKLKLEAKDIEAVSRAWKSYAAAAGIAANSSDWTKAQIADVRRWETATIDALRDVKKERLAFARATKAEDAKHLATSATLSAEQAAAIRGHRGKGGHGDLAGFLSTHALGAISAGFTAHKVYESGAHLAHEEARQSASGMSAGEIMDAAAESARIAAKFPSISPTEVNHMLRNARSIVGSYKEAAEIVEPLAKLRVVAQGARPGADVTEDFDQLVKGLEIKGVTQNPAKFREYVEGIAKGLNVFGDTLKPYQYYEMFKYGRQATPGLSQQFILGTAPTLAQELGGSSYGNAVSGFNRSIVGGRMEHSALKELYRLGLADKADLDFLKTGEVKGFKPGHATKGWQVAQEDPNRWVKEYFLPALLKAGITSTQDIQKEVSTVFSNKVAAQMVSILSTQQSRIDKDLALLRGAPGLSAADQYLRNDPMIASMALKQSVDGLTATLTAGTIRSLAPIMSDVAAAIGRYTARLTEANNWRVTHPDEATLGQKKINRMLNAVGGIDSDKSQGDLSLIDRNDADFARLQKQAEEEKPAPKLFHGAQVPGYDFSALDNLLDEEAAGNSGAKGMLKRVMDAHNARLKAQRDLIEFKRNLPHDMRMIGPGSSEIPGSAAFGLKTGARSYADYDPTLGMPLLPKEKPAIKIDTTSIDEASGKLATVLAQVEALRNAPITLGAAPDPTTPEDPPPWAGKLTPKPLPQGTPPPEPVPQGIPPWAGQLDVLTGKTAAAQEAVGGLNATVLSPSVDSSGIDALLGKINAARAGLAALGTAAAAVRGMTLPNLGAIQRGNFTAGGIRGE